jgi:hypothetical protein
MVKNRGVASDACHTQVTLLICLGTFFLIRARPKREIFGTALKGLEVPAGHIPAAGNSEVNCTVRFALGFCEAINLWFDAGEEKPSLFGPE